MAILVVCPGCRSRFQVSDQFAGKKGACPKCKAPITVPGKEEAVKIHGAEEFASGGKNAEGKIVLKPVARQETKLKTGVILAIVVEIVAVLAVAWFAGSLFKAYLAARAVGLLLVAPPLALGAYFVLRDDELEPYQGKALFFRTAICSLAYVGLWGIFAYANYYGVTADAFGWLYVGPLMLVLGALTALACYDLDFGTGCLHYAFFLFVTVLLIRLAGIGWVWQVGKVVSGQ